MQIYKANDGGKTMGVLCFGSYAKLVKTATSETNEITVNMLFDAIVKPLSIKNKVGDPFYISKGDASKLINSKLRIPLEIQRAADSKIVKSAIGNYFRDDILPRVIKSKPKLTNDVVKLIKTDAAITETDRCELLAWANENTLAELLASVFLYVVQQENDFSKKPLANTKFLTEASVEIMPDIPVHDKFHLKLLIEAKGYCPNDNCGEPLFMTKSGKTIERYKVTRISSNMPDTFENLIALCPKCHDIYSVSSTHAETERLAIIKTALTREASALETASEIKIESEIDEVLSRIASASEGELIPLNYNPVKVTEKIPKESGMLLRRTLFNVTTYFNYVKDVFQQLGKEGRLRFDAVATQVKLCYLKECGDGRSHEEIYRALVEWLRIMTNGSSDACDVVIAYFVQNCEVFDEIAK